MTPGVRQQMTQNKKTALFGIVTAVVLIAIFNSFVDRIPPQAFTNIVMHMAKRRILRYPNDFDLEQLGPYLLLFFFVVATILSVAQKISLNLIRKAFDRSKTTIAGHEVDHWVKSLEVPPEISFDQTQNNIVILCGHYYFFVAFTSYVICFGRFGYGSSFSTTNHWCLIAVGEHEVSILEKHQQVFVRLSKDDPKIGAYVVKSLPKFARLLKDSSGCRKTNCEPGDAPNPHSPSAQGAGGR